MERWACKHNGSLDLNETLHSCNTLPADVHEGIWFVKNLEGDLSVTIPE
jgi:hypothetical protein